MTYLRDEIASQPAVWERALAVDAAALPAPASGWR